MTDVAAEPRPGIPDGVDVARALEAVLMVVDEPQSLVGLASALGRPVPEVRAALAALVADYDGLELDGGLVRVDAGTGRTSNPKYFAAGDAVNGGATVVEAVRGAKLAARAIDAILAGAR